MQSAAKHLACGREVSNLTTVSEVLYCVLHDNSLATTAG